MSWVASLNGGCSERSEHKRTHTQLAASLSWNDGAGDLLPQNKLWAVKWESFWNDVLHAFKHMLDCGYVRSPA
jgi:hypothetical protein